MSEREKEVAWLICRGFTNRQIAEELFIAETTVKKHVTHVYEKCGVSGRKELKEHFPVIESYDMTLEATVTKMMWAMAHTKNAEEFKQLFYQTINHDILFV